MRLVVTNLESICSLDFSIFLSSYQRWSYHLLCPLYRCPESPSHSPHSHIWCSASVSFIAKSGALLGSATSNIHLLHFALQQSTNQSIPTIKIYTGPLSSACFGTVIYSAICEHWHRSLPVACVCHLLACLYGQMQAEPPPPWSFGFVQVQIIPSAAAVPHC